MKDEDSGEFCPIRVKLRSGIRLSRRVDCEGQVRVSPQRPSGDRVKGVGEGGAGVQRAYGQCTDNSECNGGICIKSSHELSRSNFVGSCARVLSQFSAALPSFNPEKGTASALELDVNTRPQHRTVAFATTLLTGNDAQTIASRKRTT